MEETMLSCSTSSSTTSSSGGSSPSCDTYEANNWSSDWLEWSSGSQQASAGSVEQPFPVDDQSATENYWPADGEMAYSAHVQQQYYYMEQDTTTFVTGSQQYAYEYNPWLFSYFDTRYVYEYNASQNPYGVAAATHYPQQYYVMHTLNGGAEEFQPGPRIPDTNPVIDEPSVYVPETGQRPDFTSWTEELPRSQPHAEPSKTEFQQESEPVLLTPESSQTKTEPLQADCEVTVPASGEEVAPTPDDAIHQCSHCSRYCVSAGGLKRHTRFCHSGEAVPQSADREESANENSQREHSIGSGTPSSANGTTTKRVKRSPRRKLGLKQHVCSICNVTFSSERALLEHLATHGVRKAYSCIHCQSQFSRKFHLTRHVKQRGCDGRPRVTFPCQYCQKTFSRKDNLREHMKNHTGQSRQRPKIPCPVNGCTKSFQGKTQLQSHVNGHTGIRPYMCTNCDKTFRSSAALRKHMRLHRPFSCAACQARFASKETLQLHYQTHVESSSQVSDAARMRLVQQQQQPQKNAQSLREPEEPKPGPSSSSSSIPSNAAKSLCCPECNKRFYSPQTMQLHRAVHTVGGSRLACSHCSRSFVHPSGLIRHNTQRHGYTQQQAEQQLLNQVAAVEQLEKNILDLLNLLVEPQALLELGWPRARAGSLLESVLVKCGLQPVSGDVYLQRMRANTKLLFNCIVEDQAAVENLLQSCEVNDILEQVISLAKNNQNIA